MQRIFERKFNNIENLLVQLEYHFNGINFLVKNENKKDGEKCTADPVWIILKVIDTLMTKLMCCIDHYRLVKTELTEQEQKNYSARIKNFASIVEGTRKLVAETTRIQAKGTIEFFIKKLNSVSEKIEFSWKAALPYEPPTLPEAKNIRSM